MFFAKREACFCDTRTKPYTLICMTHIPSQSIRNVYALMNGAVIQTHPSNTQYMMLLSNKTQLEKPKLSWTSVPSGGLSYKSELLLKDASRLHSV